MSSQPRAGDSITQSQLFAYLFRAPQAGDWLRYQLNAGANTILTKTVGFGAPDPDAAPGGAFIEISTASLALTGAPAMPAGSVGGSVVWKMFVDAADFTDPLHRYSITGSAFKIGDGLFRLRDSITLGTPLHGVPLQTLLWSGLVPLDDSRQGIVAQNRPQDLIVSGHTLHCADVAVDFPEAGLPAGGRFPAQRIETWQSPDVPLGTVRVRTTVMGQTYSADLIAFGRGTYHATITAPLDSMAPFPGSK
ncbi:MAG TPA: hypothetical protein VKR99_00860 [Candidatus Eremiobacteraceae bacterium]|nr:hypothetical protein [Candidatus Eremiobacteraceae bacterium]